MFKKSQRNEQTAIPALQVNGRVAMMTLVKQNHLITTLAQYLHRKVTVLTHICQILITRVLILLKSQLREYLHFYTV